MARDDRTETTERPRPRRRDRYSGRRLDQPKHPGRQLITLPDPDMLGSFSERFARFMGTAAFLLWMTAIIVIWVVWNSVGPVDLRFDNYPFIFLTLMLSLQASYAAPLILLAQNRQEARDRVQYESDRDTQQRTRADMEFLAREVASLRQSVGEIATRDFLRSELRSLLADLESRDDSDEPAGAGSGHRSGGSQAERRDSSGR
jgi:uncharacterized membrane protein